MIQKLNGEWRLVQDFRLINEAAIPLHPMVPNPYILLAQIPEDTEWFTILDLKDAFFGIPLQPDSQFLFAFENSSDQSTQLTWTVLFHDFRDSPHLFGQVLAQDLCRFDHPQTKVHRSH